jgi:hypothetical protein
MLVEKLGITPGRLSGMLLLLRAVETLQIMTGGLEKPGVMTPLVREIQQYQSDIGEPYSTLKYKYPDYNLKHFDEEVGWNNDDKDIYKGEREPTSSDYQASQCTWMTVELPKSRCSCQLLASYARRLFPRHCQLIAIKH